MHCGWMERGEWTSYDGPTDFGLGLVHYAKRGDPEAICPGYLITQPFVLEAAEAAAIPDGEIETYYPDGEGTILAARLVAKGAQNLYQLSRMKAQELKSG